jgi:hypothetical protein
MNITPSQLDLAVQEKILSENQAGELIKFIQGLPGSRPRFDFTHILYYLGGMLAIGAMTLFMNLGWEAFGGWGIFVISCLYAAGGLYLLGIFSSRKLHIPAGICAVFVVALTPLAIYGLQQGMGWWVDGSVYRDYHRYIRWHWVFMELGTLASGCFMAWKYRYPFLLMPIAATLWYMSMDLTAMLTGGKIDRELASLVSLWFGVAHIAFAFWVDIRSRKTVDYAFWLYIFGVMTFWGGLSSMESSGEWSRFCYMLVNLGLIGVGVLLVRRVFVVFGALGVTFYLGHLASTIFKNSWFFPISLTFIGLGIVLLGVGWQRHERELTTSFQGILPAPLRELLENRKDR